MAVYEKKYEPLSGNDFIMNFSLSEHPIFAHKRIGTRIPNNHDIKGQYEFMLDPNRLKTSNHIEVIKRVSNLAKKNGRTVVITGGNGANAHSIANEILEQVKQHGVNGAKIKVVNGTSPAIKLVR